MKQQELSKTFVDDQGNFRLEDKYYYCFIVGLSGRRDNTNPERVYYTTKLKSLN